MFYYASDVVQGLSVNPFGFNGDTSVIGTNSNFIITGGAQALFTSFSGNLIINGAVWSQAIGADLGVSTTNTNLTIGTTGQLIGNADAGLKIYGSYHIANAGLIQEVTNTGVVDTGIHAIGTGDITNSGTITGYDAGIYLLSATTRNDHIDNSGTISGITAGIQVENAATGTVYLNNSGTINSRSSYAYDAGSSSVNTVLTNSGTLGGSIASGSSGIAVDNSGEVLGDVLGSATASDSFINSGSIKYSIFTGGSIFGDRIVNSGFVGSSVDMGSSGNPANAIDQLNNSGTIAGGAHLFGTAVVGNSGLINDSNGDATTFIGHFTLTNSGTIETAYTAVYAADTVATDINHTDNSGTISGVQRAYFGDVAIDEIVNTGSMFGAVETGGNNDRIINTGTMTGNMVMGVGNDYVYSTGHIFGSVDLGDGDDMLYMNLADLGTNTITGGIGTDTLTNTDSSRDISLTLVATSGIENFYGGNAGETLDASAVTTALNVYAAGGDDVITTGSGADRIYGGSGADTLNGGAGVDTMYGGSGDDVLFGGADGDYLAGGSGADNLYGEGGVDTANYLDSASAVNVNLQTGIGLGGDAQGDTYDSIELVRGSNYADTLTAANVGSTLYGFGGIDTLNGGNGSDSLQGGDGADVLNGGGGTDTAYYSSTSAAVTINLLSNISTGGEAQGDTFFLVENIIGTSQGDTILGNSLNNTFYGFGGNDRLGGGTGVDTLVGGAGSDTFVFALGDTGQTAATVDQVFDYTKGALAVGDVIDFTSILAIGGTAAAATATQASINALTGVASFFAGSGTTMADALSDVATSLTTGGDSLGEFAFFQVGGAGDTYMFISDGVAGVGANDVLAQLRSLTTIGSIAISGGDLTILT